MTFRKAIERTVGARALTDPKPAFVSIVKAGANQVPFRSTKADASSLDKALQERIEAMRIAGMEVARIAFERGEHFADIEAVKSWLAEGGYGDVEIAEKDGEFEVENTADTFEDGSVVQIDAGSVGVTIWIGKLDAESVAKREGEGGEPRGKVIEVEVIDKKDAEGARDEKRAGEGGEPTPADKTDKTDKTDAAEGDPGSAGDAAKAAKDDEKPAEGDAPAAKAEGADEPKGAEKAAKTEKAEKAEEPGGGGSGGAPAAAVEGEDEIDLTVSKIVREVMARKAAIYGNEMAQRFDDFMAHFSEALTVGGVMADANDGIPVGFGEAIQSMVVAMRNNLIAGNTAGARTAAVDFGDLIVALVNAMTSVQDETQRAERCTRAIDLFTATLPKEENETADGGTQDAVLKAIADLAAKVDGNHTATTEAINEVTRRVEATEKKVDEAEAGLSERVKALEGGKQTRKSADATDEGGSPNTRKKGPIDGLRLRGALGISNVTRDGGF